MQIKHSDSRRPQTLSFHQFYQFSYNKKMVFIDVLNAQAMGTSLSIQKSEDEVLCYLTLLPTPGGAPSQGLCPHQPSLPGCPCCATGWGSGEGTNHNTSACLTQETPAKENKQKHKHKLTGFPHSLSYRFVLGFFFKKKKKNLNFLESPQRHLVPG